MFAIVRERTHTRVERMRANNPHWQPSESFQIQNTDINNCCTHSHTHTHLLTTHIYMQMFVFSSVFVSLARSLPFHALTLYLTLILFLRQFHSDMTAIITYTAIIVGKPVLQHTRREKETSKIINRMDQRLENHHDHIQNVPFLCHRTHAFH